MALATAMDVLRALGQEYTADIADLIEPWLEAAEDRVKQYLRRDPSATGTQVETFFNIKNSDPVRVKDAAPAGVVVDVYDSPLATPRTLDGEEFLVMAGGVIELRGPRYGVASPDGGTVRVLPTTYPKVRVTYTAPGAVPPLVREATAELAAYYYATRSMAASGLSSERIGDYSYTRDAQAAKGDMPDHVRRKLNVYRRSPVRST